MAETTHYRVIDRTAPRKAADPGIGDIADAICQQAAATTPHGDTGDLARGWHVIEGRETAVRLVVNDVPYARYVEYGTVNMAAEPMLGPAVAAARAGVSRR